MREWTALPSSLHHFAFMANVESSDGEEWKRGWASERDKSGSNRRMTDDCVIEKRRRMWCEKWKRMQMILMLIFRSRRIYIFKWVRNSSPNIVTNLILWKVLRCSYKQCIKIQPNKFSLQRSLNPKVSLMRNLSGCGIFFS